MTTTTYLASSYYYVSAYYYMRAHTTIYYIYVSAYPGGRDTTTCMRIRLYPRTTIYASAYDLYVRLFCQRIRLYPHTTMYAPAYDLYVRLFCQRIRLCPHILLYMRPHMTYMCPHTQVVARGSSVNSHQLYRYISVYICMYIFGIHTQVVARDSSLNPHQRAQAMLAEGKGIWPASGPTFGATEVNTDIYTHIQRERVRER